MLIPRFTIRSLLVLTAGCGVFSLVAAAGVRGQEWALVVMVMAASAGLVFLVFAPILVVAWRMASRYGRRRRHGTSPAKIESLTQALASKEPK